MIRAPKNRKQKLKEFNNERDNSTVTVGEIIIVSQQLLHLENTADNT